jgi:hypothetical protein
MNATREEGSVMVQSLKKRRARRFEIPGGKVKYKKTGLILLVKGFSIAYPVLNVSKGGLVFVCDEKLDYGDKVIVQLLVPNENPLHLRAQVRWRGRRGDSSDMLVAVEFMPFTRRRSHNSLKALDVLRRLDAQYGKEEEQEKL